VARILSHPVHGWLLLGCASGKIGIEIWQDYLECLGAVVTEQTDDNLQHTDVQSLSSSQVCSLLLSLADILWSGQSGRHHQ